MGQKSRNVATKGVQIMPRKKGSVLGMEQRSNFAVMKDVPTRPREEESVLGMGQSALLRRNAIMKDAPTNQ